MNEINEVLNNRGELNFPKFHQWFSENKQIQKLTNSKAICFQKETGSGAKTLTTIILDTNTPSYLLRMTDSTSGKVYGLVKGSVKAINNNFIHFVNKQSTLEKDKRKTARIEILKEVFNKTNFNLNQLTGTIKKEYQYLCLTDVDEIKKKVSAFLRIFSINLALYKTDDSVKELLEYDCDVCLVKKTYRNGKDFINDKNFLRSRKFTGINRNHVLRAFNNSKLFSKEIIPITFEDVTNPYVSVEGRKVVRVENKPKLVIDSISFDTKGMNFVDVIFNDKLVSLRIDSNSVRLTKSGRSKTITKTVLDGFLNNDSQLEKETIFIENRAILTQFYGNIASRVQLSQTEEALWDVLTTIEEKFQKGIVDMFKTIENLVDYENISLIIEILYNFSNKNFNKFSVYKVMM